MPDHLDRFGMKVGEVTITRRHTGPKTLIMCANALHADRVARQLADQVEPAERANRQLYDCHPTFFVNWPHASIMSRRITNILISSIVWDSIMDHEPSRRWWHESVLTRLMPGGQVIFLD